MSFKPFDIAVIVATLILLAIATALGAFDHWPPDQRPATPVIESERSVDCGT
jgi:hypothetical protein